MIRNRAFETISKEQRKKYDKVTHALGRAEEELALAEENNAPEKELELLRKKQDEANILFIDAFAEVQNQYISRYCATDEDALKEVKLVFDSLTKEDYLHWVKGKKERLNWDLSHGAKYNKEDLKQEKDLATECGLSALFFILSQVFYQDQKGKRGEKIDALALEKVYTWFPEEKLNIDYPKDNIPNITTAYPKEELKAVTRLNMKYFDPKTNWKDYKGKQVYVDIAPNDKNVDAQVILTIDPDITSDLKLTTKDEGILSSAVSLAYNNDHGIVTAHEVAKYFYYGNSQTARPSPQQVSAVKKKLDLYANNRITIDYTAHAKLNGRDLEEGEKAEISRYIYPCDIITVKSHGKIATGYRLIAKPPLYEYAEAVKQITTIPSLALNVPVNLDENKVNIREYLLKHIAHLKGKNSHWNRTITFDKIFESLGIVITNDASGRKKKSKLVKAIKTMLDYWKEIKFIKSYDIQLGKYKSAYSITFDV